MKSRNSGIEFARIFFMIAIIMGHYSFKGMGYADPENANYIWMRCFTAISCSGIGFFVMVSGYYLSNKGERRLIKVFQLILQAVLFNVAFYVGSLLIGQDTFSFRGLAGRLVPENYYVILYCCLYIISPYCNIVVDRLSDQRLRKMVITFFVLFSVVTFTVDILQSAGLPGVFVLNTIGTSGSSAGASIVNFLLLYLIGAYIRRLSITINRNALIVALTIVVGIMFAISMVNTVIAWELNNPVNIVFITIVLLLLKDCKFSNGIINEFSKATFTCYLFHSNLLAYMGIDKAVTKAFPLMLAHQLVVGFGLFVVSYLVYRIYSVCTGWFIRSVTPLCDRIDISVCSDANL